MLRHQRAEHGGGDPDFIMRVVRHFKSALSRQVGEAVRIRRRGEAGKILNSKAEYNRCRIPRLVIEEQDEELMREEEEKEIREAVEQLEEQEKAWGSTRIQAREQELGSTKSRLGKITGKVGSQKREQAPIKGAAGKKLKYKVEQEDWGEEQISSTTTTTPTSTQPSTQPVGEQESSEGAEELPGSKNRIGSPDKRVTIQTKILGFLAELEPLEPAGSSTAATVPPDLPPDQIIFEEDIGTEIDKKEHALEPERKEQEQIEEFPTLEQEGSNERHLVEK